MKKYMYFNQAVISHTETRHSAVFHKIDDVKKNKC